MFRFFKCNVLGGFRLTDLNRKVHQGEFFYVDAYICDTSRSVKAALNHKWMTEVTEDEASQHIIVPPTGELPSGVRNVETGPKRVAMNVATPNTKEVGKKIESRQAGKSFKKQPMQKQKEEDKPIVPNFNEAERRMKERQADVTTKGNDEVLKSPVKPKTEDKQEVVIKPEKPDVIKDLANDISADNSMLATPNFDEKKKEVKEQVNEEIQKRVRRRKKIETSKE